MALLRVVPVKLHIVTSSNSNDTSAFNIPVASCDKGAAALARLNMVLLLQCWIVTA